MAALGAPKLIKREKDSNPLVGVDEEVGEDPGTSVSEV